MNKKTYVVVVIILLGAIYVLIANKKTSENRITTVATTTVSPYPYNVLPTPTSILLQNTNEQWVYRTPTVKLQDEMSALLSDNNGCELPCFLGIVPGKSTLEDAKTLLLKFHLADRIYHAEGSGRYRINTFVELENISLELDITFFVQEDIVSWIKVETDLIGGGKGKTEAFKTMSRYSLSEIFQRHGVPDEIYFEMPDRYIGYYPLLVIYEGKMAILLEGETTVDADSFFTICPNIRDYEYIGLKLALISPSSATDVRTLIFDVPEGPTLEEVTGISIEEFYQLMLSEKENAGCFQVKKEY